MTTTDGANSNGVPPANQGGIPGRLIIFVASTAALAPINWLVGLLFRDYSIAAILGSILVVVLVAPFLVQSLHTEVDNIVSKLHIGGLRYKSNRFTGWVSSFFKKKMLYYPSVLTILVIAVFVLVMSPIHIVSLPCMDALTINNVDVMKIGPDDEDRTITLVVPEVDCEMLKSKGTGYAGGSSTYGGVIAPILWSNNTPRKLNYKFTNNKDINMTQDWITVHIKEES